MAPPRPTALTSWFSCARTKSGAACASALYLPLPLVNEMQFSPHVRLISLESLRRDLAPQ